MKQLRIDIQNITETLDKNTLNTCLFNLIIYSPNKERTKELHEILQHLLEKFPCRVIQIEKVVDPESEEIKVNASREKIGKNGIPCDVITILASEKMLERVPFIILPNIVADLPVYLIWGEDPTLAAKTLEALQIFSTKLIFNAAWADHLQDFSQRMLIFLKTLQIETMDISWGYFNGFRNLLTEVFNTEEKVDFLRYAKKIVIKYSGNKPKDNLAAIYLQAFLASALQWKLAAEEIHHEHQKALCYTYNKNDINVILKEDTLAVNSKGAITQFEVTGRDGTHYSLCSSKNCSKAVLHITSLESCEMPCTFAITDINRGLNFLKEIFYQTTSDSYIKTIEMVAKVNWEK